MKRTIVIFGSLALAACVGDDAAIAGYATGEGNRDGSSRGGGSSSDGASSSSSSSSSGGGGDDGGVFPDTNPALEKPGVFVAVGYGGRRVRSTDDGKTWTDDVSAVAKGGDDNTLLHTVVWGDGKFYAMGYRTTTSPDGKSWTPLSAPYGQWIGAAIWHNEMLVAAGGYGLHATSTNGTTWSDRPIDNVPTHAHDAIAFGKGRFVSANDDGARLTSPDGVTWARATGADNVATTEVAFGNGVFVAIGGSNLVRSTDGVTFTALAPLGAQCRGLIFAKGHFTAIAEGRVFTSTDGTTWANTAAATAHRGLVAYGHGTYVNLGERGIQRSADAVTWETPIAEGPGNSLEAIAFGPR